MYDYVLTITKNDKSWMINGFLKVGWVFITGTIFGTSTKLFEMFPIVHIPMRTRRKMNH
jgi:hypothetical protein